MRTRDRTGAEQKRRGREGRRGEESKMVARMIIEKPGDMHGKVVRRESSIY